MDGMRVWGKVLLTFCRNYKSKPPLRWKKDAVKYGLVTYYPRKKDQMDPEFTPTKLLMVQRVKPYAGNPYWQKQILDSMGIGEGEKSSKIAIVKNIPEVCASLWTVKHLVKITPIQQPEEGLSESSVDRVWLHQNGNIIQTPKIDQVRYEAALKVQNSDKKLDHETIQEKLRLIWLRGDVPV